MYLVGSWHYSAFYKQKSGNISSVHSSWLAFLPPSQGGQELCTLRKMNIYKRGEHYMQQEQLSILRTFVKPKCE